MMIFDQLKRNDTPLRTLTWVVLIGLGILASGLWYVQVYSHRHFSENQKAQSYRTVRIPAIRGKILDRHGQALAENQPVYNACIYLEELRPLFKQEWRKTAPKRRLKRAERAALESQSRYRVASNVVHQLKAVLQTPAELDYGAFMRHYTNQLALPLVVVSNLTPAQVARFQEQPLNLPGLDLDIQPTRHYPLRSVAAHVVGFLQRDDSSVKDEDAFFNYRLPDYKGLVGIEGAFDQQLRGRAGVKSVLVNNLGYRQTETVWTPEEPGRNVVLTLDLPLQIAAEAALQNAKANYKPIRGAVVVMDPNNGDILALVSSPGFDPSTFIPRVSYADWQRLSDEELKPQRNRATQENYAPGSIFKLVTAMAVLEAGLNPSEKYHSPPLPGDGSKGYIQVGRRMIRDTAPPGEYDFRRGFIRSSNFYFITNGLRYGVEGIIRLGEHLHLGEGVDLPTRQDNGGVFPSMRRVKAGWTPGDTANLCIGQGQIAVTPLQMVIMVSAIANGGNVHWPRLVSRLESPDAALTGQVQEFPPGRVRSQLKVTHRTLDIIRQSMLADVEDRDEGTGRLSAVDGLRVCGKTGTAQVEDFYGHVVDSTTWFASYAPFERPRYAVVVMVEGGKSGGATCAPVAQQIYKAIVQLEKQRAPKTGVMAKAM